MRYPALCLALVTLLCPIQAQEKEKAKTSTADLRKQAQALVEKGEWTDAAAKFEAIVEIDADDARSWHMLGYTRHAAGNLDDALVAHRKAAEFDEVAGVATYNIACVYALKGDKDEAFAYLEKALATGWDGIDHMATDPDMDSLRDDSRYEKIVASHKPKKKEMNVYSNTSDRQSARVSFWAGQSSPGQVVIDYGRPVWKDEYDEALDSPKLEKRRWRLGKNFWTTLDTNVDLDFAGTKVPAGYYYLTLEHKGDHEFVLAFLDPAEVRKAKLDAYFAHKSKGGIEIPMSHSDYDQAAEQLEIGIKVSKSAPTKGKMYVHFGPHLLTAVVAMHVEKTKSHY